ncbi:hypothetical protein KCP71_16170 [Salmonella enterica subsp. enterica]|nr:hypothetical protein KCP71_16170 [Salmonella enterica subsp. enterica]
MVTLQFRLTLCRWTLRRAGITGGVNAAIYCLPTCRIRGCEVNPADRRL